MKPIALITYKKIPNLSESDRLLIAPLKEVGFQPLIFCWDEKIDWKQFDSIFLRSCWDYHTRVEEFLSWLNMLEQQRINVWNPINIIRWNYQKTYLKELERKGITIIPTIWLEKNSQHDLRTILLEQQWDSAVIKPTIGLDASDLFLVNKNNILLAQKKLDALLKKSGAMLQPFIKEIQTDGELSNIFIGGKYSHTILKSPPQNEIRCNMGVAKLIKPDRKILDQVIKIYQKIQVPLLYARVDGIIVDNTFKLIELELIEPSLFFDHFPQGAEKFAHALKKLSG